MKFYELTDTFRNLFEQFDEISTIEDTPDELKEDIKQAWFDTLVGIEEEFEVKAENVGAYIKTLTADVNALKEEEHTLAKRRRTKENQIEWLKRYLLESMQAINRKEIDRPMAVLSIRNNAESVQIDNESDFITRCQMCGADDYLRYKMPEIDKAAVKADLQKGYKIEGASLVRKQSLLIK